MVSNCFLKPFWGGGFLIRVDIKRTKLFNEFNSQLQEEYFFTKNHSYLHNIDTFYYSAFILGDCEENKAVLEFLSKLKYFKDLVLKDKEDKYYFEDLQLKFTRKHFSIYEYCLSVAGYFDIFISSYLPNINTPRIVVQLRSIGLWLDGTENLIYKSFNILCRVLDEFHLVVQRTQENRIDFCYHTNSIQNMYKYFNDDLLSNNCKTSFDIYSKCGRKHKSTLSIEYLSFGNRSSNNLFVRIYNKTREVIELGYKSFFIDYWYKVGLISKYDKFIYEYAYDKGTFNSLEWGKIEFYLKFGSDVHLKKELELLKQDYSTNLEFVRKYLKGKLPEVTFITNIEFQTMRKFYKSSDKLINTFKHSSKIAQLDRLFRIIDNRKLFLNYLTSSTLCFVVDDYKSKKLEGESIYLDWWRRLRALKLSCVTATEYTREYSKKLDFNRLQARLKGTIASMSLYIDCDTNTNFDEDLSSVICSFNDNDFERHKLRIIQEDTGEILNSFLNNEDYDYMRIKENKKKSLKSLIKKAKDSNKH